MSSEIKKELKYAESHEWVRVEGTIAYVGISDYAQESLGEIVFVEIPEVDDGVKKGDEVTTIESVKAASSIYAPVSGTISEVNESLEDEPEQVNQDPYGTFLFAIDMKDPGELDSLMDAAGYEKFLAEHEE
ncbi:glycine cleavage system protein GcvH [Marispirochaeta aestuarii]|uniref:glycine cleavage system protein GcvH n=1 Tax=Marispirochaeta aestuarii TaxID=1963862 RepID=UPI0029C7B2BE|nr:glycine cleavage system protein GcvH [Marispirochaeta aestuarii]